MVPILVSLKSVISFCNSLSMYTSKILYSQQLIQLIVYIFGNNTVLVDTEKNDREVFRDQKIPQVAVWREDNTFNEK